MPSPYPDDLALARRAVCEDDAMAEIVSRYERMIYHIAYRSAASPEDAADITQETFLKAWRSLHAFRGDCSLSTWLCRIALSCACDFARGKKRRFTVPLHSHPDGEDEPYAEIPVTDVSFLPEEQAVRQMEIAAVREAIASLPEEQRLVVTLRDLGEMSYADIADTLGLELGTVKSRLNRARAAVRDFLIQRNFFPPPPSNETETITERSTDSPALVGAVRERLYDD